MSGKSGSGKDFVGREVLRPAGFRRWAFAWPMKNEAVGHGFTYNDVHFRKPPVVREFLQHRGTEEGWKKHGRMYWCSIAEAWLRTISEEYGIHKFYFTDVRFPHEAEFIKSLRGKLVRLELGDRPYKLAGTPAAEHESETALDDWAGWDAVIINGKGTTRTDIRRDLIAAGILAPPAAWLVVEDPQLTLAV